jgi:hypothetical protein
VLVRQLQSVALRHAEADEVLVVHRCVGVGKWWARRADTLRVRSGVCSFLSYQNDAATLANLSSEKGYFEGVQLLHIGMAFPKEA